jgi:protein-tyrosine phosphatase
MEPSPPSAPIRVLFVCIGNICRSPAAEGVFQQLLAERGLERAFAVDSAGTGAWHVGQPPDRRMREAAARRGIPLLSRARQLAPADLQHFDHVLTMDGENLEAVRALARAHPSTARIAALTGHCRRSRALEVPDPYYGGSEGFEQVLDLLEDACLGLLETLLEERQQPGGPDGKQAPPPQHREGS